MVSCEAMVYIEWLQTYTVIQNSFYDKKKNDLSDFAEASFTVLFDSIFINQPENGLNLSLTGMVWLICFKNVYHQLHLFNT